MYYNGYIIICIFIGAFLGSFVFTWDTLGRYDCVLSPSITPLPLEAVLTGLLSPMIEGQVKMKEVLRVVDRGHLPFGNKLFSVARVY